MAGGIGLRRFKITSPAYAGCRNLTIDGKPLNEVNYDRSDDDSRGKPLDLGSSGPAVITWEQKYKHASILTGYVANHTIVIYEVNVSTGAEVITSHTITASDCFIRVNVDAPTETRGAVQVELLAGKLTGWPFPAT